MSETDLEKQSNGVIVTHDITRVQFNKNAAHGRSGNHAASFSGARSRSRSRSLSRSRVRDPEAVLPGLFRTVSYGVDEQISERDSKSSHHENLIASKKAQQAVDVFLGTEWHALTAEQVMHELGTSMDYGLTTSEVQEKVKKYGTNAHSPPPSRLFHKIMVYCFGGFGSLLLVGGILCIISWKPLGNPDPSTANLALGVVLILIFLTQALFHAWQDFSSSRVMDSISNLVPESTVVIRNGVRQEISTKEIVPGDRVTVKAGNKVPADIRIVEASPDLKFDQSLLTGESKAIEDLSTTEASGSNYLEAKCIALQGSYCLTGNTRGIVVSTGDDTVFGSIAKLSSALKKGLTPIQKEILRFVAIIATIITIWVLIIIICW